MMRTIALAMLAALWLVGPARGDANLEIDQVVDGAYLRDSAKWTDIIDLTIEAESYGRKLKGDGRVDEEKKSIRTYFLKDTLFKEEIHELYLDGVRQDSLEILKLLKDDADRRKKGRMRNASINPLRPFYPSQRPDYEFILHGVETKQNYTCYHVTANCLIDDDQLLEGEYWFETDSLNLVRAEFNPAKLPTTIRQLDMEMDYAPTPAGYWLQTRFHLRGGGKALLFISFNFEVLEIYSRHAVKRGLPDSFFMEATDEK